MNRSYVLENKQSRDRLNKVVDSLTDEELNLLLYKEGWTISVALAHLAFWDQRRLVLVRKWKRTGITPSPIDEDTINDTLIPFFLALPPRKAADMAVSIAGELDRELEELDPGLVEALEKSGDRHALRRSIHRKMHLDDIEALLKNKKGA